MDFASGWCKSKRRLEGMTAIVTGSNTGIGRETAQDFYERGARVILACRNTVKGNVAKNDIEKEKANESNTGTLVVMKLDLSSMKSIREFSSEITASERHINILVNNAGVMMCPELKTEDGFELQMGTNHFGHALLTLLLLPLIMKSAPSRIVFVSSYLHKQNNVQFDDMNFEKTKYDALGAYCRSKAANVLFAKALALKLKEKNISNVTTYSLHPGVINTDIGRHFSETAWPGASWAFQNVMGWFVKSPRCGAQTSIYCAIDEACERQTGLYYSECAIAQASTQCQSDAEALRLWEVTIAALKLDPSYDPFNQM